MTSKDELARIFDDFGFELSEDVIDRCFDLSVTYNVEPQEFVEIFVAYCATNNDGAEPTMELVDEFERKELAHHKNKKHNDTASMKTQHEYDDYDDIADDDDDDLMEAYGCNTPTTKVKHRQIRNFRTSSADVNSSFSAQIDSPMSASTKDVKGKVVVTFGKSSLFNANDSTNTDKRTIKIERYNNDCLAADQCYMYDTLPEKTSLIADRIFEIGHEICIKLMKEHPSDYEDLLNNMTHVGVPNSKTVKCVGRICSDSDTKLDQSSTVLIGADEFQMRVARISFARLKSYALFPGQIVFAQGLNPRGDTFYVDHIHSERILNYADTPKLADDLSFVVASGPFTPNDELNYESLNELLAYCMQHKPDVLVLIGPFLDDDHRTVRECSLGKTYTDYFESLISDIIDAVGQSMEILVVSSSQDAHSSAVYPTHPYTTQKSYKNLTFLPDPCLLKVNGITIAFTATDIHSHILDAEVSLNAGDKIKRIANYLFHQRSFYPLSPPPDRVCFDAGLAQQYASLPIVPNILIMPSSTKCYARGIENCLVLNPGRLVEGSSSGTFGRIKIAANSDTKSINNYLGCQIIKI